MAPMALPALMSAVPKAIQIGTGIAQRRRGKKIKPRDLKLSKKRKEALRDAETRATSTRMAGQDRMEESLEEGAATALKEATESASTPQERMAVAAKAGADLAKGKREIDIRASQTAESRADKAVAAKERFAGEEEALDAEKRDEEVERKLALEGSGAQNIYEGVKGLAAIGVGAATDRLGEKSTGEGSRIVEDTPAGNKTGELSTEKEERLARRNERRKLYDDEWQKEQAYEAKRRRMRRRIGRRKF